MFKAITLSAYCLTVPAAVLLPGLVLRDEAMPHRAALVERGPVMTVIDGQGGAAPRLLPTPTDAPAGRATVR